VLHRPIESASVKNGVITVAPSGIAPGMAGVLRKINKATQKNEDIHTIRDNYTAHKHPTVKSWSRCYKRFRVHFTPTSAS